MVTAPFLRGTGLLGDDLMSLADEQVLRQVAVILSLSRLDHRDSSEAMVQEAEIVVAKDRSGDSRVVKLEFFAPTAGFENSPVGGGAARQLSTADVDWTPKQRRSMARCNTDS